MEVTEEMNNAEIMKNAMDEFKNIQEYMIAEKTVSCIKSTAQQSWCKSYSH